MASQTCGCWRDGAFTVLCSLHSGGNYEAANEIKIPSFTDLGPVPTKCSCPEGDFRFCHGEKDRLLLQVRAMQEIVDAAKAIGSFEHLADLEDPKDPWYRLHLAITEKREVITPKKGEFPNKAVNGCKCPCHAEIAEDGTGWPCGEEECAPCHVEPPRFR
jgi:hypothetical protein